MKIFTYVVIGWGCFLILLIILIGLASENTTFYTILDILWILPTGDGGFLLVTLASLIYGIIYFILKIVKERKIVWLSFAPFIAGVIFFIFILSVGPNLYAYLTERTFERNFAVFNQMVEDVQSEKLIKEFPSYQKMDRMESGNHFMEEKYGEAFDITRTENGYSYFLYPKKLPVRNIHWTRDEKGVTTIWFATTGRLPCSRGGFVYIADDNPDPKKIANWQLKKIKPCWYRFFG